MSNPNELDNTSPDAIPVVDPCQNCRNPMEARNCTCPRCGAIAVPVLFAAIDPAKLGGQPLNAYQAGLQAGRDQYKSQGTGEIDTAHYHPPSGLEDYYRAGWKASVDAASRPRGLHRFLRSPFNKFSDRSVFEVVESGQTVAVVHGVEHLCKAILEGHLKRTALIRIARDRDGLILAREGRTKSLLDIARRDLRVDSLYRPVFSYARRGAAWAFWLCCIAQPVIWAALLVRRAPITAFATLSLLITILGVDFEKFEWWPFAPLVLFVAITYLSQETGVWMILFSIPILAAITAAPLGYLVGALAGLTRLARAPAAPDRAWEDRAMTFLRAIGLPLAYLLLLGALCYFRWDGIEESFHYFMESLEESHGIHSLAGSPHRGTRIGDTLGRRNALCPAAPHLDAARRIS